MAASKKSSNGSEGSRETTPFVTSRRAEPEIKLQPGDAAAAAAKKLFPLFAPRATKAEGASSATPIDSDAERSAANGTHVGGTQSSQDTSQGINGGPKNKSKGKAKGAPNGSAQLSQDAWSKAAQSTVSKAKKTTSRTEDRKSSHKKQEKLKASSPIIADVDLTAPPVASTSSTSLPSTPPRERGKEVIHITDSPVRELKAGKTFEDFAAERKLKQAVKEAGGWNGGRPPLWPSRDTLHVISTEQHFAVNERPRQLPNIKRDWKGKGRAVEVIEGHASWTGEQIAAARRFATSSLSRTHQGSTTSPVDDKNKDDEQLHLVTRLKRAREGSAPEDLQQMWSSRYAPQKTTEVLEDGNAGNAALLKDWLQELMLQDPAKVMHNAKKRKIKRAVTSDERKKARKAAKRRKRKGFDESVEGDDLDDFIASDSEEEHYAYYDFSDSASLPSPTKSASSQVDAGSSRFPVLTNAILLAGPVASGKTSTAYAVANELGFQVFEVYPGIGRRGYKDLERYVGMVGENHIMKRDGPSTASSSALASFFGKAAQAKKPVEVPSSSSSPGPQAAENGHNAGGLANDAKVKQSLILIEEIDVLFNSDSGFWEGLVALIAKSRRPVIFTCNDASALPPDLLPLQCTLHFIRPPASIARSLIVEVSQHHSLKLSEKAVDRLVAYSTKGCDEGVDLRAAWNEMQSHVKAEYLDVSGVLPSSPSPESQMMSLHPVLFAIENLSFADAEIRRRLFMQTEDDESVALPSKEDDEMLDYHALPIRQLDALLTAPPSRPLPCYGREAEISSCLGLSETDSDDQLARTQRELCHSLSDLAYELFDESNVRPGDGVFHQDVLPMLREIVTADDMQDEAFKVALELSADELLLDARVRRSRRLAGSAKEGYKRHLDASKEVTLAIRDTSIKLDPQVPDEMEIPLVEAAMPESEGAIDMAGASSLVPGEAASQ